MVKKSILAKVGDKINYKLIRDGYKTGKGNIVVTTEMNTKTTIVADVPSTAYSSNLDYEVDISGENPPIINIKSDITCPDDTVISKGKYLYYDIGKEYNVKNTNWKPEFAEPNGYTIVGSPTISSEFIMTNFDDSNYISTPNLDYSSPFTLEMHLKFSSYTSGWIFKSSVNYSLDTYFGNSMIIAIGDGSSYHDMTITPSLPFNGKMILKWDGNTYTYTAIDEVSDTTYGPVTYSSSQVIPSSPMKIGYKNCDYIDLKKFIFTSSDSSKSYRAIKDESIINIPGIKDFTLNDNGTELTTKLFDYHYKEPENKANLYINNEKDDNLYYDKQEIQSNVSKVGSVIIDENGIASNFSSSDYLDLGNLDFSGDYEIILKFKMPETDSDTTTFKPFFDAKTNVYFNIAVTSYKDDNKRRIHSNSGDGSSWYTDIQGNTPLELNTEYYVKVVRSGTTRTMYLSTDNVTWSEEGSVEDTYNYSSDYCLGAVSYLQSSDIFKGSFDLTKCYIQIDTNEKKYFAETIKKRYDIPSLYSEFIDNITIPAHALYEYVNGEWKLSGTSPVITQDVTVNANDAEITMKEIEE